jgi:hypothetical protein
LRPPLPASSSPEALGNNATTTAGATDVSDDEEDDFIDEGSRAVKIFDRLFLEMQAVIVQLSQQVQQIQTSGQHIPEAQLRKLLTAEFERALLARQAQIYEDHNNVDAECLEQATWEFIANEEPRVTRAVERFQKLYEGISGQTVVGRRPGVKVETVEAKVLDAQETIEAATVYFDALTSVMKQVGAEFKADGKNLQDPAVANAFQQKFAALANYAGDSALEGIGLTLKDFQASVGEEPTGSSGGSKPHHVANAAAKGLDGNGTDASEHVNSCAARACPRAALL